MKNKAESTFRFGYKPSSNYYSSHIDTGKGVDMRISTRSGSKVACHKKTVNAK